MLLRIHEALSWVAIVGNGLAGAWALAATRAPRLRHPSLWWFTGMAQVSLFAEVGVGVWLMQATATEVPRFHTFYGFLCIVAVAVIYSYRQQMKARAHLLYGLGGLFVMGLAIRAAVLR